MTIKLLLLTLTLVSFSALGNESNNESAYNECLSNADKAAENFYNRDVHILACYEQFKKNITWGQCMETAQLIRSHDNNDKIRMSCFQQFKKTISWEQCLQNANELNLYGSSATLKKACIERFKKNISFDQCLEAGKAENLGIRNLVEARCEEIFDKGNPRRSSELTNSNISDAPRDFQSEDQGQMRADVEVNGVDAYNI